MEEQKSNKGILKNNNNDLNKLFLRANSKKSLTVKVKLSDIKNYDKIKIEQKNLELPEIELLNDEIIDKKNTKNFSLSNKFIKLMKRDKDKKLMKRKSNVIVATFLKNNLKRTLIINKEYVFSFLNKNPIYRKEVEIKAVADFLSKNYTYFTNLKNNESQLKVEKLTKITRLEVFPPGENIINYGESGDKFYIVLEGSVEVYKPIYEPISATTNEFIKILQDIKNKEKNEKKYLRIKAYNKERNIDISNYENIDSKMNFMNVKSEFFIEKMEKLGKYGEGFSFGEIALIKKTERNATIKSVGAPDENIILLSIDKIAYNQAVKEYQEKKITQEIELYISTYPFLNIFSKEKILKVFSCMNLITLAKGEYLFHQNDVDDYLYFVINGNLDLSINFCYTWLNDYLDYIVNIKNNIIGHLCVKKPKKLSEVADIIEDLKEKPGESPMKFDKYGLWEKLESKINKNNLIGLKSEEEKLNDNKNLQKIHVKTIDKPELLGIEDAFEFKNKFYTIQCVSDKAEIKSIKAVDLIKIIYHFHEKELTHLLDIVLTRKRILKNQIIKSVQLLSNQILTHLEFKYENLINSARNTDKEQFKNNNVENGNNKIISLIKMKGYKNSVQDMLDKSIDFLDLEQEEILNFDLLQNKKSIIYSNRNYDIEDLIIAGKKKNPNYSKTNNIFNNNHSINLMLLKNLMKSNKSTKNIKKPYKNELSLNKILINKSNSNQSILQSLSNRNIYHNNNYSEVNTNNESNMISNTNINTLNSNYNKKYNFSNIKKSINSNYLYKLYNSNKLKLIRQSKKFSNTNYNFHNSKSNKNIYNSPITHKNYINNKLNHFSFRDLIYSPQKNNPILTFNNLNSITKEKEKEKEKNIILNTNNSNYNNSDISLKNFLKNLSEKSFLDKSKSSVKKDKRFYGYMHNNKEIFLGNQFSHRISNFFESPIRLKKYNFPLFKNWKVRDKSK